MVVSKPSPTEPARRVSTSNAGVHVPRIDANSLTLKETVVTINRVAKVVKGGKRFSFSALVVIGDGAGHVGAAIGKAKEVQAAIQKAVSHAKKTIVKIPLKNGTIPHEVKGIFGAGTVLLKPAVSGTGVIAGGSVRAVVEAVGIRDILSKSLRSTNPFNVVYATLAGLKDLETREDSFRRRGKELPVANAAPVVPSAAV
ncbi:MAG: 30S ribosomal protein S5 [Elusimicrobia bacterium]|nr:30S ribosomal protein S5 [Elusimicrobiota bacterium]